MVDTKKLKEVAATLTAVASSPGSFPAAVPLGVSQVLTASTVGVQFVALTSADGSAVIDAVADNAAAPATPTGIFVEGIFRATLPTYTDGDAVIPHFDSRGRLLVSPGETGLTADVETDQDPAPATPVGAFLMTKFAATLPTYVDGDAATLHADSVGRLITTSIDPVTGASFSISTEDSAGPTNPVGTFSLGLFRTVLPTYTDGDAAILHFTSDGLLRTDATLTTTLPSSATTASVAGAAASTSLLASNASRLGATFFNDQPTDETGEILFLLLDAAVASTTNYTVQMAPNTYFEVPFGYTGEIRGIWGAATGDVRITELT